MKKEGRREEGEFVELANDKSAASFLPILSFVRFLSFFSSYKLTSTCLRLLRRHVATSTSASKTAKS